jgi:hypothetical protein
MVRDIGVALILYAVACGLPAVWLAVNFHYPEILRQPPDVILSAFANGGPALILAWAFFALAALLLAPLAVAVSRVTTAPSGVAALGVAAGLAQAVALSRWVYVVPGLADSWEAADDTSRAGIEALFMTLHQFAGVGMGEAVGQTLTGFWLIGVAASQHRHPRYGRLLGWLGLAGGGVLVLGLAEGLATVVDFDPGLLSLAAPLGFLILAIWMVWTGIACVRHTDIHE